ncbi:MAG: SCO family protein, partial [Myxococcota bacterium]
MRSPGSALRAAAWLLPSLVIVLGCGSDARRYEARGVVYDVNREFQQILVEHEDIPGLMPAMTMNFDVADPALLETLATGDRIVFELEFTGDGYRVLSAEKLGQGEVGDLRLDGLARVRTPAPDFDLTDQSGARVSLEGLRGRTLLVDFVYTRCPGPCPALTSQHVALQRKLPPELRKRVWFVSISIDPAYDTPEALRAYAESRGADLARWSFLTGDPREVSAVVKRFGVGSLREPDGTIDHLVATFVVDAEGRIAERFIGLEHATEALRRAL